MSLHQPSLAITLRRVVDARAGIATRLWEMTADALAPDLFVAAVEGPAASYFINHERAAWSNTSSGSGAAFTRDQALWATVGETMERYSASIYDPDAFTLAREAELPNSVIDMSAFILFAPEQYAQAGFGYHAYDPQRPRAWIKGKYLASGAPVWAPAQMVYLSQGWGAEEVLGQTVSTGLACQVSEEAAALSGILELVERDGFASAWLLKWGPPRLLLDEATRALLSPQCRKALANPELPITLCAAPNPFGVFNVFAFAEHPQLGVGCVGACARLTLAAAVEKAVIEVLHGWAATLRARNGVEPIPEKHEIKSPHDHSVYYHSAAAWADMAWFRSSTETVGPDDLQVGLAVKTLSDLVQRLEEHEIATSCYDVTSEDVALIGFHVVKVLAPGLQPLLFGFGAVANDRRRLEANAVFWGINPNTALNLEPHPFP